MTALRELREKVAAGEFPAGVSGNHLGLGIAILTPHEAFSGSLDAAKALHEALLPGWGWQISSDTDAVIFKFFGSEPNTIEEQADTPARAWLLAILDALISWTGRSPCRQRDHGGSDE